MSIPVPDWAASVSIILFTAIRNYFTALTVHWHAILAGFVTIICAGYTRPVKLALAQINPTIGDFPGNIRKIVDRSLEDHRSGAQLVIFPELAICGYPPADLLEKPSFLARSQDALVQIAEAATAGNDFAVLCGCPTQAPGN